MSVFVPAQRNLFGSDRKKHPKSSQVKYRPSSLSTCSSLSTISSVSGELPIDYSRTVTPVSEWPDYSIMAFTKKHLATQEQPTSNQAEQISEQDDLTLAGDEDEEPQSRLKMCLIKYAKMIVPHVVLLVVLLSYLSLGALALIWFESGAETQLGRQKIARLQHAHARIAQETFAYIHSPNKTEEQWRVLMRSRLYELSVIHGGDDFAQDHRTFPRMDTKWTFPTALLNALTLLSACGYGEVMPRTDIGQLFAVAFTLTGIPLMFITAADIGKFLSEVLMALTHLAKLINARLHKLFRTKKAQLAAEQNDEDQLMDIEFFNRAPEMLQTLWMPCLIYVSVISAYCTLGTFIFRSWQPDWTFVHAFHFGFNLIVTVGLGDIVVRSSLLLCLLVAFVIVGLSVVTMCVDLASTHLKAYFMRIHYFGRAHKFLEATEDIKQMMEYLAWMKRKKGGSLTWRDVRDLMETIRHGSYNPRAAAKWRWIDESLSCDTSSFANSQSALGNFIRT